MNKLILALTQSCLIILFSVPVTQAATTIDFESIGTYTPLGAGDIAPVASSVVTNNFQNLGVLFGESGLSTGVAVVRDGLTPSSGLNTVAGLNASGDIPGTGSGGAVGDIYFSFVIPNTTTLALTDFISFTIGDGGGDLDLFQIRSYDLANSLVNTQNVSGISRFLVIINTSGVHRVEVDFTGDYGYSLDDLTFNTPIPAPSAVMLGSIGVGIVNWLRRRKTI